jgi:hypothetical protein
MDLPAQAGAHLMRALSLLLLGALAQPAAEAAAQAPAPKAGTHVLIVSGISGGDEQFAKDFVAAGKRIAEAAQTKFGAPSGQVTFLAEQPAADPQAIRGPSTKAEIEKAFARITTAAKPGDVVLVVLIGHGSAQGTAVSMFNIPGPDMGAVDFRKLLAPLSKQQVAFVNTTSASGDFVGALAGKNRVIITSTMSPMERNYSKFAKYFSAAFSDGDGNKDGRVSLLEAYDYARRKVEQEYTSATLLQSEHSRLDDNGDGTGTEIADLAAADGRLAARFYLNGVAPEDPKLTALLQERDALRIKLDGLLAARATADAATYWPKLEGALVDLVVVSLKVRQLGAGTGAKP